MAYSIRLNHLSNYHLKRIFGRRCCYKILLSLLIASLFMAIVIGPYLSSPLTGHYQPIVIQGASSFCPPFDHLRHNKKIFFLETSGEPCLTPRQMCSIESAARMNPQMKIILYTNVDLSANRSVSHRVNAHGNRRDCSIMSETLSELENVEVIRSNLKDQLRGTPFSGRLNESRYPHVHLSDMLRIVLLERLGGLYLDLDVVVLRPLHCLNNTAAFLSYLPSWVENGVLTWEQHHPFIHFLMKIMLLTYKPDVRESMGPPSLGLAIKLYCNVKLNDSFQHETAYKCQGNQRIHLHPPESFYAIKSFESSKFVQSQMEPEAVEALRTSYLSHVYFHTRHRIPPSSLYASLARSYCPTVYSKVPQNDF